MRRRDFIAALGGAAAFSVSSPHIARAQQSAMPVIGLLIGGAPDADTFRVTAFLQGLSTAGYAERQNVAIEYRWALNQYDKLPALMAELVERRVTLIAAIGNAAAQAAKAANTTIPIVFEVGDDPVKLGLVASLGRPGGTITGVTFLGGSLAPKLFEVLQEAVPQARIVGLLENPTNPNVESVRKDVRAAAASFGKQLVIAPATFERDFEAAFAALKQQGVTALLVRSDVLFNGRPKPLVALAAHHAMPAIYPLREFPLAGGLMSYGASLSEALRQTGVYAGRILRGEKASELAVQQSAKVELVINLRTAKALGLTFPLSLLGRADEVIE